MNLLQTLTLGTHRLPPTPEVTDYLTLRDAIDPTADDAEKALAAYAITERLERLKITTTDRPTRTDAIPETRQPATGKLGRALKLVFEEEYLPVLPEAIRVMEKNGYLFPPYLLPKLLDFAYQRQSEEPAVSASALTAGGNRATWLAAQHPEWATLTEVYDFAEEWAKAATPAQLRTVLERWRRRDPNAAREALAQWWAGQSPKNQETLLEAMRINLSSEDLAWLRQCMAPKRKGVRRALLTLLLLGKEEQATEDLFFVATASLQDNGSFVNILKNEEAKELINAYGGLQARETIGEFLSANLAPTTLPDLVGLAPEEYWPKLNKRELKAAAKAMIHFHDLAIQEAFVTYTLSARRDQLPLPQLAEIAVGLPRENFERVFHSFMDRERDGFRDGGIAPLLAVTRREPWSERITKALIHSFVGRIRDSRGMAFGASREQSELWKRAVPLLHVDTFAFLRQHLHAITERPDVFGKLALSMLQTTAFRRVLYDETR